jgi:hypothetical protein|tara:strand:+ start:7554 stop:12758 length:5205 start_codon:yes stop_codon:yes gene_type:complete
MAEVKNAFIKSKMNKDLDARLLPNGEYREGINIQVSRSEGADVGALENVLGNKQLVDFRTLSGCSCELKTIGTFTDGVSNDIFVFLTNYTDVNFKTATTYNKDAYNYVYVYNILNKESYILTSGAYLNFSTTNPVLNVNFLEGILFWTDNRNQPRKLNINSATPNATSQFSNGYYTKEDQISVATYNPYQPIELYFKQWGHVTGVSQSPAPSVFVVVEKESLSGLPTIGATVTDWPDGATITAPQPTIVSYDALNGILQLSSAQTIAANTKLYFYIDNSFASQNAVNFSSMFDATSRLCPDEVTANPTFQTEGPLTASSESNYPGDPDFLEDKFVRFSYRFKFEDGENSIFAPFTQPAFIPKQDGCFLNATTPTGNTTDENATYRSTIVSFMENQVNNILVKIPLPCDANVLYEEYKITEIDILYKESDALAVQVVDTIQVENLTQAETFAIYNYQGVKPYKTLPTKELIRVYDKVPVRAHGQEIISNRLVYSNFQTQHTPPEALNYNVGVTQKESFDISATNVDGQPQPSLFYTSDVEYPQHTVKQNRNYQVGIILSDRFGRTSTVILSSADIQGAQGGISYGGSTVYVPYKPFPGTGLNTINSWPGDSIKVLFNQAIGTTGLYAGDPDLLTGWPGLYNGDNTSEKYNPLGWYSYTIVVKQQEQDYYNVYLPGIVNGYPGDTAGPYPDPVNTVSFITLMSDNINKVPRDLNLVGPLQEQFRSSNHDSDTKEGREAASQADTFTDFTRSGSSSLRLFGRVTPEQTAIDVSPVYNNPYYPTIEPNVVNTIGTENTLLDSTIVFDEIYQTKTNPLIARVSQSIQTLSTGIGTGAIGSGPVDPADGYNILLGIYETAPTESRLELFWETSSAGLISDLNKAIEEGGSPGIKGVTSDGISTTWSYSQSEADPSGTIVAAAFYPFRQPDPFSSVITAVDESSINNWWVTDGLGNTRTSDFLLEPIVGTAIASYNLKTARNFYYGNNASVLENYTFFFEIYDVLKDITSTVSTTGALVNTAPSITNCVTSLDPPSGSISLYTYEATNGSADITPVNVPGIPPANTLDLTFSKISQYPLLPIIYINESTGELTDPTGSLNGILVVGIKVEDASGAEGSLIDTCITTLNGSQGILTRPTNDSWYKGDNLIINAGPESSGFYWSTDKTNEVASIPLPGTGNISFRAPVNNQPTPTDVIGGTGINTANVNAQGACGGGTGLSDSWVWTNTNRNALAFDFANTNPSGLSEGTAYIIVNFENKVTINGGPQADKPSVIWPTYLQYRDSNAAGYPDNWIDAIDVEGKAIKFGGTQTNNYSISLDSARPDFTETGVMDRPTTSSSLTDSEYSEIDAMQAQTTGRASADNLSLFSKGSRIFAFGKDQGYAVRPDYFGDYRLVVRYPFGDNVPNSLTSFGNKIIPVLTPQGCPGQQGGSSSNSPYASYASSLDTQLVKLSYGDFYNPLIDGVAPSYFSYRLSSQGSSDKENAQSFVPSQVVYAREWSFRYITQLYTDPELSIPYAGTTNLLYYSYSATGDTSLNGKYGNEMSNTTNTALTGTDRAPVGNASNEDRRWVAQFDGNGKKMAQTAEPVVYDQQDIAPALQPPTLSNPPGQTVPKLNPTNFGPFPQIINNVSAGSLTLMWSGGASQATFANTFVKNLTNNLGGETPAPFASPALFLKFYSPDESTGYVEVSVVSLNMNGNQSNVSYIYDGTVAQVRVSITNAQNVITGSSAGNLPSSNYYYGYN